MTNGDPELAKHIADDMGKTAWRLREQLVNGTKVYGMTEGVRLAKEAVAKGNTPVTLADHSDRSGAAIWLLDQVIKQKLGNTLICTVADKELIDKLRKKGVKVGDAFDELVGGRLDVSAGDPVRVVGKVHTVSGAIPGFGAGGSQVWVSVKFGDNNVLVISPYLYQVVDPKEFTEIGLDPAQFKVHAIKSRVHFRRGFYDSGYARTILLVEPEQPFLGTVRIDALPYKYLDIKKFYPYGTNVTYNP
jgi:microcystin degradation protein MlrC